MILAAALLIGVFGKTFVGGVAGSLYKFIARPHSIRVDGSEELRERCPKPSHSSASPC